MEQIDGIYEGEVDMSYKKEGLGIFISDSGEIYIGIKIKLNVWFIIFKWTNR